MEQTNCAQVIPLTSYEGRHRRGAYGREDRSWTSEALASRDGRVFWSIWENSNEGMRLTDERGIIVAVNQAFCRLVSMREQELVGKHFTAVYATSEDTEALSRAYETKFTSGNIQTRFERTHRLRTGKQIDVEITNAFVVADEGRPLMLAQFHDLSERRSMQQALIESELKYRSLFTNSVQPMFESSIDGRVINANHAFLKLLGYEDMVELADCEIGRDIYVNGDDRQLMIQAIEERGYLSNIEVQLRRKNGRILTVIEHSRAVRDSQGNLVGLEGILEDVTARKAVEEKFREYVDALEETKSGLDELNAAKDKLLSILSHDLRSPLGSILGLVDLLLNHHQELTPQEQAEDLRHIRDAALDHLAMVDRILDWSRLKTGRIRMEMKDLDVSNVIGTSLDSVAAIAHQRQITLASDVPAHSIVRGDEKQLGQVFTNLLSNCLKYTPAGGSVRVALAGQKENNLIVTVADTGIGIPLEVLQKLFRVEEQLSRRGLNGERGAGIGLSIVQEIMRRHDGAVGVDSEVGSGTTIFLQIPEPTPACDRSGGIQEVPARHQDPE